MLLRCVATPRDVGQRVGFVATVQNYLYLYEAPARVVINSRTGTIVTGKDEAVRGYYPRRPDRHHRRNPNGVAAQCPCRRETTSHQVSGIESRRHTHV